MHVVSLGFMRYSVFILFVARLSYSFLGEGGLSLQSFRHAIIYITVNNFHRNQIICFNQWYSFCVLEKGIMYCEMGVNWLK